MRRALLRNLSSRREKKSGKGEGSRWLWQAVLLQKRCISVYETLKLIGNLFNFFWGDVRCLPSEHVESNYNMTFETLLSWIPIHSENVHRIHGELLVAQAAQNYEEEFAIFLVGHYRGSTWFSLVWEAMVILHHFSPVSGWKEKSRNGLLPLYIGSPLYLWWIVSL